MTERNPDLLDLGSATEILRWWQRLHPEVRLNLHASNDLCLLIVAGFRALRHSRAVATECRKMLDEMHRAQPELKDGGDAREEDQPDATEL
jgi:hypothetical protein